MNRISLIIKLIKKNILFLFSTCLLSMLLRSLIIFGCIFFIAPKFNDQLNDSIIQIQLWFLMIVVVELIVLKINQTELGESPAKNTKGFLGKKANKTIHYQFRNLLKGKPCFLFLYKSDLTITELLKNQNYTLLNSNNFKDLPIKLYGNFHNTIIGCEISEFKKIMHDEDNKVIKKDIIYGIKRYPCPSINIIVSVEDLIEFKKERTGLLNDFYFNIQNINSFIGQNYNINVLIDKVASIEGFYDLFSIDVQKKNKKFGLLFLTDITNLNVTLQKFSYSFGCMLKELNKMLIQTRKIADYQNAYLFIGQLKNISKLIEKLIECLISPSSNSLFFTSKEAFITVQFINTTKVDESIPPLIGEELANYINEENA